ncbi:MAG TPA: T9SS type A sorting domain-containing protein [Edaphocola sp.]|nr:T9SS type A sorting domain-containing protein [Edaphocola sp.]
MKKLIFYNLSLLFFFNSLISNSQPIRDWVSYFGTNLTNVSGVHFDSVNQCIYTFGVTGDTSGISTPNAYKPYYQPSFFSTPAGPHDYDGSAFLSKWDKNGNLIWSTYYGGSGKEFAPRVTTDHSGNIYIMGYTESDTGMISPTAFISNFAVSSFYLSKFNPQGLRLWSTYLCESDSVFLGQWEYGLKQINNYFVFDLDIDYNNNIFLTFPVSYHKGIGTPGTHKPFKNPTDSLNTGSYTYYYPFDIALLKIDSNGNKIWGTYYGGSKNENNATVYYSKNGFVYLAGSTSSDSGIATNNTFQTNLSAFGGGGFLAKFNTNGQRIWGTYIGGNQVVIIKKVTEDLAGNVYVYGITSSTTGISTNGTFQSQLNGGMSWFLIKFNAQGQRIWGTYIGKSDSYNMVNYNNIDQTGNESVTYSPRENALYVQGLTIDSTDFDTPCGYPVTTQSKGFLAKIDTSGNLIWASHYDAALYDISIAENQEGKNEIYFVGTAFLDNLATPGAYKEFKTNFKNGIIGKFIEDNDCDTITLSLSFENGLLKTDSNYSTYQWYHNNNLIATTSSPQLSITDTTGTYWVLTESCTCQYYSNPLNFSNTGIHTILKDSFKIYPNPANTEIFIDYPFNSKWRISVYNLEGKELQTIKNMPAPKSINVSNYPQGLYYIKINDGKQSFFKSFTIKR